MVRISILILFVKPGLSTWASTFNMLQRKRMVKNTLIESNINSKQTSTRQIFEWDIEHSLIHAVIFVIPSGVILNWKIEEHENFQIRSMHRFPPPRRSRHWSNKIFIYSTLLLLSSCKCLFSPPHWNVSIGYNSSSPSIIWKWKVCIARVHRALRYRMCTYNA